ncbi:MAG: hypothetical protein IPK82_35935 [Polyangiaceae bacterium]|nr:hypothetical protein [Polyangiaceae bacterium]
MKLAVVGMGLCSPLGLTPEEHAFFVRAEVAASAPGGFVNQENELIPAVYCPWLGADLPISERLISLAQTALVTAVEPLSTTLFVGSSGRLRASLHLITGAARPGLSTDDRTAVENQLASRFDPSRVGRGTGEASFFSTLGSLADRLPRASEQAAVILAVDSFISLPALAEYQRIFRSPWAPDLPRPGEAAACVVVMLPEAARRERLEVLANIHCAGTEKGESNDDNDLPVDGSALTNLIRAASFPGNKVFSSFGPHGGDSLRRKEWEMAAARLPEKVDSYAVPVCIESVLGRVGAASALSSLVFGIATHQHQTWTEPRASDGAFLTWAISPDGTRGHCRVLAGRYLTVEPRRLQALAARPLAPASSVKTATRDAPRLLSPRVSAHQPSLPNFTKPSHVEPTLGEIGFDLDELLGAKVGNDQPVSIAKDRAQPEPFETFRAGIVADCLDKVAMLARHRMVRPMRFRPRIEERLLAQVDGLAVAGLTLDNAQVYLENEAEDDLWAVWAPTFALSCFAGPEPLSNVYTLVETAVPPVHGVPPIAAAALCASPHPELDSLVADLLDASEPQSNAIALLVSAARGFCGPDRVRPFLKSSHPIVVAAAARAFSLFDASVFQGKAAIPFPWEELRSLLVSTDIDIAYNAARTLTLWGDRVPCTEIRMNGLGIQWGTRVLETLILAGVPDDVDRFLTLTRALPLSTEALSAVGRFGHPAARPYLLNALIQPDFTDDAVAALTTLFGPVVTGDAVTDPQAWAHATAAFDLARPVRFRMGAPWSAKGVAAELASLNLSGESAEQRIDELHARAGARPKVDVQSFWPTLRPAVVSVAG